MARLANYFFSFANHSDEANLHNDYFMLAFLEYKRACESNWNKKVSNQTQLFTFNFSTLSAHAFNVHCISNTRLQTCMGVYTKKPGP